MLCSLCLPLLLAIFSLNYITMILTAQRAMGEALKVFAKPPVQRIAIIGAGAAGLCAAKVMASSGFDIVVYEKNSYIGGVWKYTGSGPMYATLRTNLPKEVMAFSLEEPFNQPVDRSYLYHYEVQQYLEEYAIKYDLLRYVRLLEEVIEVKLIGRERGEENSEEEWPRWQITSRHENEVKLEVFDAVMVCNGHFDLPRLPPLGGLGQKLRGQVGHARDYDRIRDQLAGRRVLVVGVKSSGTDMARELSGQGGRVFVCDRGRPPSAPPHFVPYSNIALLCGIKQFIENGVVLEDGTVMRLKEREGERGEGGGTAVVEDEGEGAGLGEQGESKGKLEINEINIDGDSDMNSNKENSVEKPGEIDIDYILFCTGYHYSLPFFSTSSSSSPAYVKDGKKVSPLYKQLFSVSTPSLAFIGLPYQVLPFFLFNIQIKIALAVYKGEISLPPRRERQAASELEDEQVGDRGHDLGKGLQFDYLRDLLALFPYSNVKDRDLEANNLNLMQAIYEDNSSNKPEYTGAADSYRERRYDVDWENFAYNVRNL